MDVVLIGHAYKSVIRNKMSSTTSILAFFSIFGYFYIWANENAEEIVNIEE